MTPFSFWKKYLTEFYVCLLIIDENKNWLSFVF